MEFHQPYLLIWIIVVPSRTSYNTNRVSPLCSPFIGAALKPTACLWWSTKWMKGFPMNSNFPSETTTNGRGMPARGLTHLKSHHKCRALWPRGWTLGKGMERYHLQKEPISLEASPVMDAPWSEGECPIKVCSISSLNLSNSTTSTQH